MSQEETIKSDAASPLIDLAIEKNRAALASLLATIEATPDDKWDFKPSETSRSIHQLVEHAIEGNHYVGASFGLTLDLASEGLDRATLVSKLKDSTEAIISKVESLTSQDLETNVQFFNMQMPMPMFALINEWHLVRHTGQIDYIQTIYGDLENHRP